MYDLLRYHLGWIDQRGQPETPPVRPRFFSTLALVACKAVAGDFHPALPAAAGIELIHNFTLVHRDVQSNRQQADDRPSIWWIWGPAQAINAGDGLHALGRTTIMRLVHRGVPAARVLRAVEALDKACLNLCEGQFIDLEFQEQLMVTETDYLDMISRKTGSLGRCAAETGAIAAGADDGLCAVLREAGNWLGMSWQISQDIADLWGERGDGMTHSNVLNKRKSLPVVHALENATVAAKRELGAIYMKRVLQPEDAARIVAILEESDSRSPAQNQARAMVEQAVASLVEAGIPQERLDDVRALGEWALSGQE